MIFWDTFFILYIFPLDSFIQGTIFFYCLIAMWKRLIIETEIRDWPLGHNSSHQMQFFRIPSFYPLETVPSTFLSQSLSWFPGAGSILTEFSERDCRTEPSSLPTFAFCAEFNSDILPVTLAMSLSSLLTHTLPWRSSLHCHIIFAALSKYYPTN